ncbi:MAG: hypothetical protein Q4Q03_05635 [Bowdeniella nasicola]|nr:hypothetical protein [Bowdeniella nasicola]
MSVFPNMLSTRKVVARSVRITDTKDLSASTRAAVLQPGAQSEVLVWFTTAADA